MKTSKLLLCLSLLLGFTPVASGGLPPVAKGFGGMDGRALLPMCRAAVEQLGGKTLSPSKQIRATRCVSYIQGFTDAYVMRDSTPQTPARFCFPYPLSSSDLTRAVTQWLEEHQGGELDKPAWGLVFSALKDKFACGHSVANPTPH